ncbi:unnamed protein product, partial [marine sediment metagenome]
KPGDPEPDFIPYIRVDRVNYSDGSHPENFVIGGLKNLCVLHGKTKSV